MEEKSMFGFTLNVIANEETGVYELHLSIDDYEEWSRHIFSISDVETAIRTGILLGWFNAWDAAAHMMQSRRGDAVSDMERNRIWVDFKRD